MNYSIKIRKLGFFLFCMALFTRSAAVFGFEITDALGRTLSFERAPERIVVAGRGLVMVADALYLFSEARSRVIAVEKITLGKGGFLPAIDPAFSMKTELPIEVGVEPIVSLRPDAVLMKSYMQQKLGQRLEALDVPVVYLEFETPRQYERDLMVLGTLLQNRARAEYLVSHFRDRAAQVEKRIATHPDRERPRVLFLYYSERGGGRAFNVPPGSWMQTILVERAGGDPVWTEIGAGRGWARVSFEQIAAWDADYIFVTSYFTDVDKVKAVLLGDPLWISLRAVREGRLFAFPTDYYSWDMPSSRWILGLTWLAGKLYPHLFADVDLAAEIQTFFRDLYFLDGETYDQHIRSKLGGDLP
jgi:iron complex transport system substrate-binding protein